MQLPSPLYYLQNGSGWPLKRFSHLLGTLLKIATCDFTIHYLLQAYLKNFNFN
jgi:hypothetical protein